MVLIGVFGALVAALLPLTLGVVSIVIALALAFFVGQWMNLSVFLETFVTTPAGPTVTGRNPKR